MKKNNLKGSAILCVTSLIWGLAFVAQTRAADFVPAFAFNSLRCAVGTVALILFYLLTNKSGQPFFPKDRAMKKVYLKAALLCGLFFTVSVNLQQFGFMFYPEGAAAEARGGFLTALYVVIVPIFSVFLGKKIHPAVILGVMITVLGVYFLCLSGGFGEIYFGDVLMFLCAVGFSLQILSIDKYCSTVGSVKLSIFQFFICAVISALLSLIFEKATFSGIVRVLPEVLYLGIMSTGVGYTLQIVGQKYAEPPVASIVMSLEGVFAALGGWLISGNRLSLREILGCFLVFCAIIVSQLPSIFEWRKKEKTGKIMSV